MSETTLPGRKPKSVTPWYRQAWPWFLISLPATAVVAGLATAWIAVASDDGLVVDDYYKQGMAIQMTIDRAREAARQGLSADLVFTAEFVEVRLKSAQNAPLPNALFLTVSHPTRGGLDQAVSLVGRDGNYNAGLAALQPGHWNILLEDESRQWRLNGAMYLPTENQVRLEHSALASFD